MGLFKSIKKAWDDLRGKTDERKANALLAAESDRQARVREEMGKYLDEINTGLEGRRRDYLNAVLNANSIGNAYLNNYLASINGLADTNYNQGVTSLQRSIANTENAIRNQMANRGISGAGVDFRNLVNSQGALARGISALQAQRQSDRAKVAAEKYNAGSSVNATNFNRMQSYHAYNPQMTDAQLYKYNLMGGNLQPSEYTQARIAQHQEKAKNPALTKLISAGVNAAAGNWLGAVGSLTGGSSGNWLGAVGNLFGGNKNNATSYGTPTYLPSNFTYSNTDWAHNWHGSSADNIISSASPIYSPYDNMEFRYRNF